MGWARRVGIGGGGGGGVAGRWTIHPFSQADVNEVCFGSNNACAEKQEEEGEGEGGGAFWAGHVGVEAMWAIVEARRRRETRARHPGWSLPACVLCCFGVVGVVEQGVPLCVR